MNSLYNSHTYVRNTPWDVWWRKYGHWIYIATLGAVLLWVPNCTDESVALFQKIPAIRSLMGSSAAPCRIALWVAASIALYPLLHILFRSCVIVTNFSPWKMAVMVLLFIALDAMLAAILFWESTGDASGHGPSKAWSKLIKSDGIGFLLVAIPTSITYSFMGFMSFHIVSLRFFRFNTQE